MIDEVMNFLQVFRDLKIVVCHDGSNLRCQDEAGVPLLPLLFCPADSSVPLTQRHLRVIAQRTGIMQEYYQWILFYTGLPGAVEIILEVFVLPLTEFFNYRFNTAGVALPVLPGRKGLSVYIPNG